MPVAFDSTVSKGVTNTATTTMTATPTAGTAGILFVGTVTNGSSTSTITATYDGAAMTQMGSTAHSGAYVSVYYAHMAVFKIDSVPSGSKTISITGSGTVTGLYATFISYTGVGSIGNLQVRGVSGSASMSHTTTSSNNNMVAQSFYSPLATAITVYNKTERGRPEARMIVGDSAGSASVAFTATSNSSTYYHSMAVDLVDPLPNRFFAMF